MEHAQLNLPLDVPARRPDPATTQHRARDQLPASSHRMASGEKTKARDLLAAIRTLKTIEQERRPATDDEKQTLARFSGFGPLALSIFPEPASGRYRDAV